MSAEGDPALTHALADGHVHLFENGFRGELGVSPCGGPEVTAYERLRLRHGISVALVVGFEGEPHYAGNNEYLLRLVRDHDWIRPVVYRAPGDGRDTFGDMANGAVGASCYPAKCAGPEFVPWLKRLVAELDDAGAILSLNAAPVHYPDVLAALGHTESVNVLLSHLGLPAAERDARSAAAWRQLLELPNVSVKISGLYAVEAPRHCYPHEAAQRLVVELVDLVGPQRLVWGSDFAPALDYVSFVQTTDVLAITALEQPDREAVLGANLIRMLKEAGNRRVHQ